MDSKDISIKKAAMFNAASKYTNVIFQLLATSILARLISAEESGVVAVILVFSTFFKLLTDMGLGVGVVQNKELSDDDVNHIYSFTVYIGIIMVPLFCLVSYPIAWFFKNDVYVPIGRILSVALLFQSLNMIPNAVLMKRKEFAKVAIRTVIVSFVTYLLTIVLAFAGLSYYALAMQSVISSIAAFVWNICSTKLRFHIKVNFGSVKKIFSYSTYNMAFNITNYFARNLDNLLCGKFIGEAALGFYNKAYNLMLYPVQYLTNVITPALHPILSEHQDDSDYIYKKYIPILKTLSLIGVFASVFCCVASEELVLILYGSKWRQTIPCMSALAVSIWFQMTSSTCGVIYQSLGDSKLMFKSATIFVPLQVICIFVGTLSGDIASLSIIVAASFVVKFLVDFYFLVVKSFKRSLGEFFKTFIPEVIIALIMSVSLFFAQKLHLNNIVISFAYKLTVGICAYLVGMVVTNQHHYVMSLIPSRFKSKHKSKTTEKVNDVAVTDFTPYSEENELLATQYQKDNYCIVNNEEYDLEKVCYIYFSSNGLYRVDSEESFKKNIINADRYEWRSLKPEKIPQKEIFIRDIWLSWYVKGINNKLNNIEKVLEWLRLETEGYRIVTVGNSSGGYMAALAAQYLDAKMAFSFCGQFSLENHKDHLVTNPLLIKYKTDIEHSKWFECYRYLEKTPIVYFCPSGVDHDRIQAEFATKIPHCAMFHILSDIHGVTVYNFNIPKILSWDYEFAKSLSDKLSDKVIKPFDFSVKALGASKTVFLLLKTKLKKFNKKTTKK